MFCRSNSPNKNITIVGNTFGFMQKRTFSGLCNENFLAFQKNILQNAKTYSVILQVRIYSTNIFCFNEKDVVFILKHNAYSSHKLKC